MDFIIIGVGLIFQGTWKTVAILQVPIFINLMQLFGIRSMEQTILPADPVAWCAEWVAAEQSMVCIVGLSLRKIKKKHF